VSEGVQVEPRGGSTSSDCFRSTRGRRRTYQTLHAAFFLCIPAACTVLAAWRLCSGRSERWEVPLTLAFYFATMLGISVGFHRLIAHRAFDTTGALWRVLVVLGCMAGQGAPIYWASNHRRHHRFVDRRGDPHSPQCDDARRSLRGFWHAHVGWTFTHDLTNTTVFSKDLLRNSLLIRLNRYYYHWIVLGLVASGVGGAILGGSWAAAGDGMLWATGVRLFLTFHMTASINSITHMFGYRRFETRDRSRNNPWLSIPTCGEAWHNNHHACPSCACFARKWWEVDLGGLVVLALQRMGLAWNVRGPSRPA
jgi:stearoyl-CoA desaturase (delta-9 desaturase)